MDDGDSGVRKRVEEGQIEFVKNFGRGVLPVRNEHTNRLLIQWVLRNSVGHF